MRQPTEEQLDVWESEHGDSLRVVPVPEVEDDFEIIIRPLAFAEFVEFVNAAGKPDQARNASVLAMHRAALWPSRADVNRAAGVLSGLPRRVTKELQKLAGAYQEAWRVLGAYTTDEELTELGIPVQAAADLRAKYPHPGQLVICRIAEIDITLIVKRPTSACAMRLGERYKEAFFDATTDAAIECTVWPEPEKVAETFRRYPAIAPLILFEKIADLGKGEGEIAAKKFTRKGKRSAT